MSTRRLLVHPLLIALALAGCSGSPAGSSAQAPRQRGGGFARDPKVVACLKKQGVALPAGRGRPPANASRPDPSAGAGAARFQKLRAALQKCGVTPRQPGPPGAG